MPPSRIPPVYTPPPPIVVHWFRRDLRTVDNPALNAAIAKSLATKRPLVPLYILDPTLNTPSTCSRVRSRFLLESLSALSCTLSSSSAGRLRLRILRGSATKLLPTLATSWNIKHLFFEHELSPQARARDQNVRHALSNLSVSVNTLHAFTLYDPRLLLQEAAGTPPTSMPAFLSLVDRVGHPSRPLTFPESDAATLPSADAVAIAHHPDHPDIFHVPALEDLGYHAVEPSAFPTEHFLGGQQAALDRLAQFMARDNGRAAVRFSKPDTSPAALTPRATTVLSPHLALGTLSARTLYDALRDLRVDSRAQVQTTLRGQLLWREHFWLLAFTVPNFGVMQGNPLCRQIAWRTDAESKQQLLAKWREARTGFPWIDALMTQLRTEGFVHHLGRHSLACFLTRGDLWVSWEEGAAVFEYYLIDYDFALNSANWMWLSCSAFFNRFFRVYSPVAFAKKWDKDGQFVRHYLPVLKKLPTKYIHEPWKAPIAVQRAAGCIVGKDYPKPMVDHATASKENIEKMKQAFKDSKPSGLDMDSGVRENTSTRKAPGRPKKRQRAA